MRFFNFQKKYFKFIDFFLCYYWVFLFKAEVVREIMFERFHIKYYFHWTFLSNFPFFILHIFLWSFLLFVCYCRVWHFSMITRSIFSDFFLLFSFLFSLHLLHFFYLFSLFWNYGEIACFLFVQWSLYYDFNSFKHYLDKNCKYELNSKFRQNITIKQSELFLVKQEWKKRNVQICSSYRKSLKNCFFS